MDYFWSDERVFKIADSNYIYTFSYDNGIELSSEKYCWVDIIEHREDEELLRNGGNIFYKNVDCRIKLPFSYSDENIYTVSNGITVEYSERHLNAYCGNIKVGKLTSEDESYFRQVVLDSGRAYILTCSKRDPLSNRIEVYEICC